MTRTRMSTSGELNCVKESKITNSITITSPEISSLEAMDELFQSYCTKNGIYLDFGKSTKYNAYVSSETAMAHVWFIRGCFRAIGDDYLKDLFII